MIPEEKRKLHEPNTSTILERVQAIDKIKDAAKDGLEALSNIMGFEMEVNDTLLNNNSLRLKI